MSALRTVLFVSRYFPPAFDVGGRRAYHLARYLPEFGYRSVIVAGREPSEEKRDPAPLVLPSSTRLIREFEPQGYEPSKARLSDGTVAAPVSESGGRAGFGALLKRQFALPLGPEARLVPHLRKVLVRVIAEERPDVVVASSSPYAVLLAGHLAGSACDVPVCLDLRDPWSLNFLQRGKAHWVREVEARLERFLFDRAALVTVTSEATAEAYRQLYPSRAGLITTVHNAFDPARRPHGATEKRSGPLRLVHFGNCYGPRSLETVLRAMAVLRERAPGVPVKLLNLGRVSERDLELASNLGVADSFEYRPVVPYDEGIELLARSDLPILLAYGEETLFIPAKLYDYLLAGTPFLCVSNPSELTGLVEELEAGSSVAPHDVEGAVRVIERVIEQRASGTLRRIPEDRAERFSAPTAARKFAAALDRVLAERAR